ncbi:hypothetical protein [Rhodoblastus sp.]|jgi:hypothetical protein|uniref:hypothetical protein n=1 Tax=Rhodoblastus sp. TaxID=1962975 RepID=UPI0025EE64F3|nr:hypothetical protein [Rhodoblastus sp.]
MLNAIIENKSSRIRSLAAIALVAGLALQSAPVQAAAVNARDFQAFGYDIRLQSDEHAEWRKPNGAEIIGGFYGADDQVNTRTGEIRHR